MKWYHMIPYWLLMAVLLLIIATVAATRKSQERTECYRKAQSVSECPKPAAWEMWIAWIST